MEVKTDESRRLIAFDVDDLRLLLNARWVLVSHQNTHSRELALIDRMLDSQTEETPAMNETTPVHSVQALERLVQCLFLCLSWDARQNAKHMLTEVDKQILRTAIQGEPNW